MNDQGTWIEHLNDEDRSFLKRFILASGSLKELAQAYEISYPTVRLRLDRLIAKVQVFDSQEKMTEFERTARAMFVDGKIDMATFKSLLAAHFKDLKGGSDDTAVNQHAGGVGAGQ